MGKQPKKQGNGGVKTNVPLILFATFLVVAGIVGAAYLSSHRPPGETEAPAAQTEAPTQTETEPIKLSGRILLANADSVTVIGTDGQAQRLTTADFWDRSKSEKLPAEGSSAANGSGVYLLSPEQASGTRESFLSPDRRYVARLGAPKRDNAASLEVYQGNEAPQTIVLRDRKGKALSNAVLLGWLGPRTLAVVAVATSTRAIFTAELNGTLQQLIQLPDNVVYAEARSGAVWYATAQLGEGLESAPTGPSELHRATADGQGILAARDGLRVFQVAVPDGQGRIMYTTDDGQAFLMDIGDDTSRVALGKKHPLAYLPDGKLLLREGFGLLVWDPADGRTRELAKLPEGEVRVFVMP